VTRPLELIVTPTLAADMTARVQGSASHARAGLDRPAVKLLLNLEDYGSLVRAGVNFKFL
jgi:hypothetical protein